MTSDVQIIHPLVNLLRFGIGREVYGFIKRLNALTGRLLVLSSEVLNWGLVSERLNILAGLTVRRCGGFNIQCLDVVGNRSGGSLVKGFD